MGSAFSKVSPSGADGAIGNTEGITLDVTPELREQIKVHLLCFCSTISVPVASSHFSFRW
jgi:hypothetical protein